MPAATSAEAIRRALVRPEPAAGDGVARHLASCRFDPAVMRRSGRWYWRGAVESV